jgi:hypothetical protein
MCAGHEDDQQPEKLGASWRTEWMNLRQPGPIGWKLRRTIANTVTKVVHRQPCCGHDGEPGC